jgi:hypothetical protein
VEGLDIVLVIAATLVIVGLLAVVPLVAGRRRRPGAYTQMTLPTRRSG